MFGCDLEDVNILKVRSRAVLFFAAGRASPWLLHTADALPRGSVLDSQQDFVAAHLLSVHKASGAVPQEKCGEDESVH
jgi:hypothetical protein